MEKPVWIALAIGAGLLTAGTVAMNDTPGIAQERARTATTRQSSGEQVPVVVEFFTSQGCSSCPPSDRLAAKLAAERGVLVIQRPVTYWDRLGWTDTLGKAANTSLQRAYARRTLGGRNGIYTPQAVVAGSVGLVGSDEASLRQEIAKARTGNRTQIRLMRKTDGLTEIIVEGEARRRAGVLLVGLDSNETVAVSRGENGGRTLRYTNIWKGEAQLGTYAGGKATLAFAPADRRIPAADRYAVIVREGNGGPILAGVMLP